MACLGAMWDGLGLTYVACPMPCLDAKWHSLAYVPCGMSKLRLGAMWHGVCLTQMLVAWPRLNLCSHVMSRPICKCR